MKVVFRTDASVTMGTGHVVRCLTLAKQLALSGAECHFVMRQLDGNMIAVVEESGFPVIALEIPDCAAIHFGDLAHSAWLGVDWRVDAEDTLTAIKTLGDIDWLVVDHYAIDVRWELALRGTSDHIMVIDDLADRIHDCDILLDQNLQITDDRYSGLLPANCIRLIGPKFALLRREFSDLAAGFIRKPIEPVKKIIVYMGGVDVHGSTILVLRALSMLNSQPEVDVIIGNANPHKEEIIQLCSSMQSVNLHCETTNMAEMICNADIAIGAAGTTTWERCCFSIPSILISIADNQKPSAEALASIGAAIYMGHVSMLQKHDLAFAIEALIAIPSLRNSLARRSHALVDGRGVQRVMAWLRPNPVELRRATPDDSACLFEWRNAAETRKYFQNSDPISKVDHERWLKRVFEGNDVDLLIGEISGAPVGVIRYDHDQSVAKVSIYLVPGRAGKGVGQLLLRGGNNWLEKNRREARVVEGIVLKDNHYSHGAFEATGFDCSAAVYRQMIQKPSLQ